MLGSRLGILFGARKQTDSDRRVPVYITPYVWEPGLDTPSRVTEGVSEFVREQSMYDTDE